MPSPSSGVPWLPVLALLAGAIALQLAAASTGVDAIRIRPPVPVPNPDPCTSNLNSGSNGNGTFTRFTPPSYADGSLFSPTLSLTFSCCSPSRPDDDVSLSICPPQTHCNQPWNFMTQNLCSGTFVDVAARLLVAVRFCTMPIPQACQQPGPSTRSTLSMAEVSSTMAATGYTYTYTTILQAIPAADKTERLPTPTANVNPWACSANPVSRAGQLRTAVRVELALAIACTALGLLSCILHVRIRNRLRHSKSTLVHCALLATILSFAPFEMVQAGQFVVSSPMDAGTGTLRAAIELANASPGHDTIRVVLTPKSAIVLDAPLPLLSESFTLLGGDAVLSGTDIISSGLVISASASG